MEHAFFVGTSRSCLKHEARRQSVALRKECTLRAPFSIKGTSSAMLALPFYPGGERQRKAR